MSNTIPVYVQACDPLSEAGLAASIRQRAEVRVVDRDLVCKSTIGVLAAERLDEEALRLLRGMKGLGIDQVVLVAGSLDEEGVIAAAEAGVAGLLRRNEATPDRLVQVLSSVCRGAGVVPPDLLGRLLKQVASLQHHVLSPRGIGLSGLTDRETEVLRLVATGFGTQEIAQQLAYSERTVKNTLHDVTSRFHLRNRSHAVAYAIREGYI
ncbi:response regulator transcription factor [Kitasatospora mediocidica]|uniref:response regulator transcription factor n=1 Tax=Kitasatospora mediocidica TaxID=58352 RepID=UPI000569A082|nr:response regulator transcription factor [Kitasatospora mediocidica]